jgi:hypothetical protein
MRKLFVLGMAVIGVAAINALIGASRECGCQPECWCQKPGLRHFRWVLPFSHKAVSREWKQQMQSDALD